MSTRKALRIVSGLVLGLAMLMPVAARADETDQSTRMTFNRPVEIPGNKVLPAGTYWFKLVDAPVAQHVVQISNANRSKVLATYIAIPTQRRATSENPELKFAIPEHRNPAILRGWYYPDQLTGHEFLYGPRQQSRMSEESSVTVMAHRAKSSQNSLYGVNAPQQGPQPGS
jgi:hypothetical protein